MLSEISCSLFHQMMSFTCTHFCKVDAICHAMMKTQSPHKRPFEWGFPISHL